MKTLRFPTALLTPILLLATLACNNEDMQGPLISPEEAMEFNTMVEDLQTFTQPAEQNTPEELSASDPARDEVDEALECSTITYQAAPGFDQMLALDPTTDVIYPGALLQGASIPTGEYIPIVADRAPITLSASLTNISGSPVVQVEDPKLSTVREGVKSILDQEITGATPAEINFEVSQVYSEEHLTLALGANYEGATKQVSASFNFAQSTYSNKFVIKYLQVYYTIDVDAPDSPSDFFRTLPVLANLGATLPVYIASVAYGRMVIYTVESDYQYSEIDAAFRSSFASGDGSIDATYTEIISSSSIKALVIGGSGADAAQAINGPQEVYNYIANGGDYSQESPGAPLSYKLRFLTEGTPVARVVLSTEYNVRQCDLAYPVFTIKLNNIKLEDSNDGDGNTDLFGYVGGRLSLDGSWVRRNNDVMDVYWGRSESSALNFRGTHTVNDRIDIEVYRPDYDEDYIQLYGRLTDKDILEDDFLGSRTFEVKLSQLQINVPYLVNGDEPSLIFDEQSGQRVVANYSIVRTR